MVIKPLDAEQLYVRCDPAQFDFKTTADLEDLTEFFGQARALEAVRFGTGIRHRGYNLFALGPSGTGRHSLVNKYLEQKSADEEKPSDWGYVNNFQQPHKPNALKLPAGRAPKLRDDMNQLVEELRTAIPAVFGSEDHRMRMQEIEQELKDRQDQAFADLQAQAEAHHITLLRTPTGFAFAPARDGEVISPDEFEKLPEKEQKRIEDEIESLQEKLQKIINQIPLWVKETREKVKTLSREVTRFAVGHLLEDVKKDYEDLPAVLQYLDEVGEDVIEHAEDFQESEEHALPLLGIVEKPSFHRYQVNILVDNSGTQGAPVIYEDNPTFQNLVGRTEHASQMGTLVTDFTLIKPGALHRANGGYLILDAHKLLTSPYAWEGMKRSLFADEIKIESLGQALSIISTVSLEPESIPLDVKVVLIGERILYYLLNEYDNDFAELFKVEADFEDNVERNDVNTLMYARLIATQVRKEDMLHFDRSAVARVIEHSGRLEEDTRKLTTHVLSITDLLRESDYLARQNGNQHVTAADVQQAIDGQLRRADRVPSRLKENIERGISLIDTEGAVAGQVNGLTVIELGNFYFGQPSRITATARIGDGDFIDIENEVELGGSIHSKGMLILSSYLQSRYSEHAPLSLSASVTFEQSYGMVEGDSASAGELCALLSAIAQVPIKQSLAVTGSVNQLGQVQAIGGVNEKIEGFYDTCKIKGLTGEQGVIIPASNVQHLMLNNEVVEAAKAGKFHIYTVETVDQAAGLLTGMTAGEADEEGNYPEDTLNYLVEKRLMQFAETKQAFSDGKHKHESEHEHGENDGEAEKSDN